MKIEYFENDTAYLALKRHVKRNDVAYTTNGNALLPEPWQTKDVQLTFSLEWDADGRLLGLRFSPASAILPKDELEAATKP